jgi:1,2-phenylacetyl-CoA epoxidase PaaB subunit
VAPRSKSHRYRVLFEQSRQSEDVSHTVVTKGSEAKAVWMASAAFAREQPECTAWAVEVEDLGTDFQPDPANDLLAWDEVS